MFQTFGDLITKCGTIKSIDLQKHLLFAWSEVFEMSLSAIFFGSRDFI